jgi:hypothetical protein
MQFSYSLHTGLEGKSWNQLPQLTTTCGLAYNHSSPFLSPSGLHVSCECCCMQCETELVDLFAMHETPVGPQLLVRLL